MATMFLKDTLVCPVCGQEMFPSDYDGESKKIVYQCSACGEKKECDFETAKRSNDEKPNYFVVNDDGNVSWKCFTHALCEYPISSLLGKDFTKFQRCCCILGRDEEEIEADVEFADGEGRDKIAKILDAIGEDCIPELADELLLDVDIEEFDYDYLEAFVTQAKINDDGVQDFIDQMIDRIYECFEITVDEDGNLEDE